MKNNTYNDGVLKVHEEIPKSSYFNAKENTDSKDDLKFITFMNFEQMSERQQDVAFAESLERTLSIKVKVPLFDKIQSNHKITIDDYLYDIIHLDKDRKKKELYLYLERVRKLVEET